MGRSSIPLCNHVKANGTVCESPALKDEAFCFFHTAAHERVKRQRRAARNKMPFQLPLLEDAEAVQLAIGDTLNALVAGQIDHKTAGLLLYGLQTAAGNVRHTRFRIHESSRAYNHYHNQEEEKIEREIQEEIAAESAAPTTAPSGAATSCEEQNAPRPGADVSKSNEDLSRHPQEGVSPKSGPAVSPASSTADSPASASPSQPDLPPKKSSAPAPSSDDARKKA